MRNACGSVAMRTRQLASLVGVVLALVAGCGPKLSEEEQILLADQRYLEQEWREFHRTWSNTAYNGPVPPNRLYVPGTIELRTDINETVLKYLCDTERDSAKDLKVVGPVSSPEFKKFVADSHRIVEAYKAECRDYDQVNQYRPVQPSTTPKRVFSY